MDKEFKLKAPKMGIYADHVIRKAQEFARLADVRLGSSSLALAPNISSHCKVVICLELAARHGAVGQSLDSNEAACVAGMNKNLYLRALKSMEKVLGLQCNTTVPELTVQFGCPGARNMALQILQRYHANRTSQNSVEYSEVLFNSAALFAACRKMKIRVDKKKLTELSGVKKGGFDKLVAQMDEIASAVMEHQPLQNKKRSKSFLDEIETLADQEEEECPTKQSKQLKKDDDQIFQTEEEYKQWKKEILERARCALNIRH